MIKNINFFLHYPIPKMFNYIHSHSEGQNTKLIFKFQSLDLETGNIYSLQPG